MKSDNSTADQEIIHLLWSTKFHCRFHNIPSIGPYSRPDYLVRVFHLCFFKDSLPFQPVFPGTCYVDVLLIRPASVTESSPLCGISYTYCAAGGNLTQLNR